MGAWKGEVGTRGLGERVVDLIRSLGRIEGSIFGRLNGEDGKIRRRRKTSRRRMGLIEARL